MKGWISRLLHYCCRDVLQEGWSLQRIGLCYKYWNDSIAVEIYLQNG